jgi:hypothetical protein
MHNKIAIARAGVCRIFIGIGCKEIIQRRMLSRKSHGEFVAVARRSVYDDCDNQKAMEFA